MNDKNSTGVLNKLGSSVSECTSFCYNKSKEVTVNSSKSAALWCVQKLLNASKTVENITNARSEEETLIPDNAGSKTSAKLNNKSATKSKQHKSRKHIDKGNHEVSTTIEVPLQETIDEYSSSDGISCNKPNKRATKKKTIQVDTPKEPSQQTPELDAVGFSFFPPKSRLKASKPDKLDTKKSTNTKKIATEAASPTDNVGFSFIPVKERKVVKKTGKESLNEKTPSPTKVHNNQPSVKHKQSFDNKAQGNSLTNILKPVQEPLCVKKVIPTLGKSNVYVAGDIENKSGVNDNHTDFAYKLIKSSFTPVSESRKVDASVSYAQITSQNTRSESIKNDVYSGVKEKLQLFENIASGPVKSAENSKTEGPELSRLHKILLTESESLKKDQTFQYLAISTEVEKPESSQKDCLTLRNIETSSKEISNSGSKINELIRSERTEVESSHNHTNNSNFASVSNKSNSCKLINNALVQSKGDSIQTLNELQAELNFQPNKFNNIQECLENEQTFNKFQRNEVQKLTSPSMQDPSTEKRSPLVLEKTFEIFENQSPKVTESVTEDNFHVLEKHTHSAESNLHLIEKQYHIDESYDETNNSICKPDHGTPSVIETSTIIETSPLIEASTIIETFPNLGSCPIVETSTVVTSNTGLTPNLEASTIIESFPLRSSRTVLETSTIIVTTLSETKSTPIIFETSATIEALPPSQTQSLLEALTIVETPSPSSASVDIVTSSIIESLPELEDVTSANRTAIKETAFEDTIVKPKSVPLPNCVKAQTISKKKNMVSKRIKMTPSTQVRVLTLNDNENQESTLYRLEKNWILEFRLGPSLLGRKVNLYCNYPPKTGEQLDFDRTKYQLLEWTQDEGCQDADDTALETQLELTIAGSFHYFFTYGLESTFQGSGFFLVNPVLTYGNDEELPLDCIQCQTVISKGLGSFDSWESKLRVSKESGYNMIHFTPIQELGASNSAYSISDQSKLNPIFGEKVNFDNVEELMSKIRREWKVTSICDIVLNHTANDSKWIHNNPDATYNCSNCPYMRPAYLLDAALHQFSMDVKKGLYESKGIPLEIDSEDHLKAVQYHLQQYLSELNIPELFMCNVNQCIAEFLYSARKVAPVPTNKSDIRKIELIQNPEYKRLASSIDLNLALSLYNTFRSDCFDEESRLKRCAEELKCKLDSLNNIMIQMVNDQLTEAVENCIASIRYDRVQHDGPKMKDISIEHPLIHRYFTDHSVPVSLKEHEQIMYSSNSKYLMAHNGWVMNADPLNNFAAPGSEVYVRRQLIAWGDSVKLRYGNKPDESPFLWNHMKLYVEQMATIFDGVRLDNCHSTPIHVAEYLLDCARKVKPDLYVVAELFTNSDHTDNVFVNKLGITSLIREAMAAWDSHEEGRLVYRYGGYPVGSFYQPNIRPLVPSIAHALFMDATHDNPSPVEKRSVFDMLPSTALVNMACCASGSNRGYDELVPHHIHVVNETREYTEWISDETKVKENARYVSGASGIIAAKKAINALHYKLGANGFNQVYVDQMDADIVAVTRHSPITHQSYILVAFTAFQNPNEDAATHQRGIKPLRVEGALDEIVLEATLSHTALRLSGSKYAKPQKFAQDSDYINGFTDYAVDMKQNIQLSESTIFEKVDSGTHNMIQLNFKNFHPGSIVIIKVSLPEDMRESVENVRKLVMEFSLNKETQVSKIIDNMTLADLNRALYRCDQEERDEGNGFDVYHIPHFAPMVYAGFQGFLSLLANIRPNNDLGHPMCCNLRDGNWMIDYIWQRLKLDEGTKEFGRWIEENTKSLKAIPRYLIPCYFDVIITGIYILLLEHSYKLMSKFVESGSTFVKALALGSVQCGAFIKSANLPQLSPNLAAPKPSQRQDKDDNQIQSCVSLSAGLPHFSVGYMRNWGRDTFIALRGLLIMTGRFQEARYHILGYGGCLRHGLIPNLLDGGNNSRYNCRDAVWWWLHSIKSYVEEAPNGIEILKDIVSRIFPTDDSQAQPVGTVEQPLHDVIQECLAVHFQGLTFRERNAGRQIDEHMMDNGFNNQIGVHPETGFIFGGNDANCGTWMDKMGSSDKAGNRGKPATPRDGSAIELIGLSKSVITWLDKLYKEKLYPYDGVERVHKNGSSTKWSFKQWSDRIQTNFSKYFWVNVSPTEGEIRPDLINKRGIYKDCYGASQEWTDYQLRCNFPIAMVTAPELFNPQHAWIALSNAEKYLLGPLGMKTLDPEDWAYNGDYDNSNDSNDYNIANGFNYHQGPEWIWPLGFYLRAKLKFAEENGALKETLAEVKVILSKHYIELQTSPWKGLPELTNKNGSYCKDSAKTQAWSMSCILEVLDDLQKIERSHFV